MYIQSRRVWMGQTSGGLLLNQAAIHRRSQAGTRVRSQPGWSYQNEAAAHMPASGPLISRAVTSETTLPPIRSTMTYSAAKRLKSHGAQLSPGARNRRAAGPVATVTDTQPATAQFQA